MAKGKKQGDEVTWPGALPISAEAQLIGVEAAERWWALAMEGIRKSARDPSKITDESVAQVLGPELFKLLHADSVACSVTEGAWRKAAEKRIARLEAEVTALADAKKRGR